MHLIQSLLNQRRKHTDVFERGDYQPLEIRGRYMENVCAYARKFRHEWYVTVVPVNIAQLCSEKNCNLESFDWEDTRLILPEELSPVSRNILMDEESDVEGEILIGELFSVLPVALVKFRTENERASGILMHITSLPSAFGVGDLGPEAKEFIDFLYETKQRFWQILPLNPTTAQSAYSPYSSVSSRAGNTMLISPELLVKEGLLKDAEIRKWRKQPTASADFPTAERIRKTLFELAWNRYSQGNFPDVERAFNEFCQKENSWLDDFSLFMIIRDKESGKPWIEWPEETKDRNPEALQRIREEFPKELKKVKWLQFIFYHQWKQLRKYCRKSGVALFGDIPIYVSHNSADVWANRDIFRLYSDGRIKGMAGVPPDYFSETGQLWGMPVFEWKKLKKQNYQWWIDRLRVNRQLFDLIRIDHFRAFADYWEVPAGEETAINGKWKTGPGMQFFEHVKEVLGEIPFVAEDLGEISPEVFQLRDDLQIPGMKVLQFGFGEDMAQSDHIPHNFTKRFVVYPGTHDNDTVSGWFKSEGKKFKDQIERYVGRKLKAKDFPQVFCQMAEASVAKTAILPIQDLLSLGGGSRMNNPGGGDN